MSFKREKKVEAYLLAKVLGRQSNALLDWFTTQIMIILSIGNEVYNWAQVIDGMIVDQLATIYIRGDFYMFTCLLRVIVESFDF